MPRPKSFDPDTVLAKAMGVFWEKGFDAASISDLTEAMGINRFSLYDTFGDKQDLYHQTLDAYNRIVVLPFIEKIDAINSINDFRAYFISAIESQHSCGQSLCCMMHKASLSRASCDQETSDRVVCVRNRVHRAICDALARAGEAGELKADLNISDAGWMIKIAMSGLASHAASPIPAKDSLAAFELLLDIIRA